MIRIPLHASTLGDEEIDAAVAVLRSGRVTMGSRVEEFEAAFAVKTGFRHAVMVNSGSSANLLALSAVVTSGRQLDWLHPDQYVAIPAVTWATQVWPVIQHRLRPLIVDVDGRTWGMRRGVALDHTEYLWPVHVYGCPLPSANPSMIEDCCEALGAIGVDGYHVGKSARIATFSLYFSHHITTIEGGVCCTDNDDDAETLRIQRAHGWTRDLPTEARTRYATKHPDIDPNFLFVDVGYNVRPTEIAAAIGIVQLKKLDDLVAARNFNWRHFRDTLGRCPFEFQSPAPGCKPAWFGFNLLVKEEAPFTRNDLRHFLESNGIEVRPVIAGNIARQPGLKKHPHRIAGPLTQADRIMDRALSIGCHQGIGAEEREYVTNVFKRFVEGGERAGEVRV